MDITWVKFLYEVLKDRPDLFITVTLLVGYVLERLERKALQKDNIGLVDKMAEQNKDINETLGNIKYLLEILTRGRF